VTALRAVRDGAAALFFVVWALVGAVVLGGLILATTGEYSVPAVPTPLVSVDPDGMGQPDR
jgi:hypothetical protein